MGTINIDGRTFSGNSISIINGKLFIDGKPVDPNSTLSGVVEIRVVEGTIGQLHSDASITCGAVEGDVRAGGSVNCDSVRGNVSAGGSVNCDSVSGNVSAGGTVNCDDVGGNVTASIVKRG